MSEANFYAKAKEAFEQLDIGERISALELAERIGATIYPQKKKVAAFLSQQASKGRVKKQIGEDRRMYYEKLPPIPKATPLPVASSSVRSNDTITIGEIGESIVNYIEGLKERIAAMEVERDKLKEKVRIFSKQKEAFKRIYQEAEQKVKELSSQQPVAKKTVRISKILGE